MSKKDIGKRMLSTSEIIGLINGNRLKVINSNHTNPDLSFDPKEKYSMVQAYVDNQGRMQSYEEMGFMDLHEAYNKLDYSKGFNQLIIAKVPNTPWQV